MLNGEESKLACYRISSKKIEVVAVCLISFLPGNCREISRQSGYRPNTIRACFAYLREKGLAKKQVDPVKGSFYIPVKRPAPCL
jgi:hypothetical protein